jgi:tRNA-splicing ligase RtcB (3'-phosphate/5'-hydroxy nucleic acid ligase)
VGNVNTVEPRRVSAYEWEIAVGTVAGMRVPGKIFASESLFRKALEDRAVEQVANVATLPGIVGFSMAMPDVHWGYGFPIGGVAATAVDDDGVISPGGVGFDIGCGVRLLRTDLSFEEEVRPRLRELVDALGRGIPRGVGGAGAMPLSRDDLEEVLRTGARAAVARGAGWDEDLECSEDAGTLPDPAPHFVSDRAKERGVTQLGSLGAGNHFVELQVVDEVRDEQAAAVMGLLPGAACVMIHSGSRGIGHQTCTDSLRSIDRIMKPLGIEVPDRQLACVPLSHEQAQRYLGAMDAAGNFAKANRQVLTHEVRRAFESVFGGEARKLGIFTVYDVSHNLAKMEEHEVDGRRRTLCVHRKGATRAFGPGNPDVPVRYRDIGQPVIVPGSMGTASFVMTGTRGTDRLSFGSTCHGAGRAMSRTQAKRRMTGAELKRELESRGILVAKSHLKLLSEEAPYAYKDADQVVETCEGAGLGRIVARLRPVGVVKG